MPASRIKIKRPLSHQLIIALYFLAPIINIIILSLLYNKSISIILTNFFKYYGPVTAIWLITAPVVAIGLYFVHMISWSIFLAHSIFLIVGGIVVTVVNPVLYNFLMQLGNFTLVIIIGFIIRRNFRAPYFQAIPRSWREKKRLPIEHIIKINGVEHKVTDLSETGCFVSGKDTKFEMGEGLYAHFKSENVVVKAAGEVARETDDGYGIRFVAMTKAAKKAIKKMIKNRYALRYAVDLEATWESEGLSVAGRIVNISKTGLFFACNTAEIKAGDAGKISIKLGEQSLTFSGTVVWINSEEGKYGKSQGVGLKFKKTQSKVIEKIRHEIQKLVLTR